MLFLNTWVSSFLHLTTNNKKLLFILLKSQKFEFSNFIELPLFYSAQHGNKAYDCKYISENKWLRWFILPPTPPPTNKCTNIDTEGTGVQKDVGGMGVEWGCVQWNLDITKSSFR